MKPEEKHDHIGLINYEGNCLKAVASPRGNIVIYDSFDELCEIMDVYEFLDFIDGKVSVFDSEGKDWTFTEHPKEARPSFTDLYNFINRISVEE